ncbi:bcl-2-related ovarian killer protein homolog A-like isoform X2 [Hylaeus volcanicus]|uniref:bcl-2-related ovarian killer protein homolog A-like isoform X2 n=1 Tax=Hylaeus volcanicus TaxID=313075 RepID=UPI0023B840E7|nr:bcl-2-related ovarian killer protein homolog A-like isoform X2 [Hylaeus volcanicus]
MSLLAYKPEKPEWHQYSLEDSSMSGLVGSLRVLEDTSGNATQPYRRNSLAISLHSNLSGFTSANNPEITPFHVVDSARRRFSNVSDVVSRKISHTIRWRTVSASVELTVSQGSSLCAQYIRNRLKRSGIFHRKLGLKRMRSVMLLPGGTVVGEVYPELISVGAELEKMHPNLFNRVARQIGCSSFSTEQSASEAVADVSREMIRNGEMTWSKVIALYAVAGGIAVDCVRQGKPEYLLAIQRGMTDVLEEDLAVWIQANGGWSALATRYRPVTEETTWYTHKFVLLFIFTMLSVGMVSILLKFLIL